MIGAIIDRVIRGPEPPVGVVYTHQRSLRCRVGLHRWDGVWEAMRGPVEPNESGGFGIEFGFNLDREPDYIECARCGAMHHGEPEPRP